MLLSGEFNNFFIGLIATLMALFVAMPFHEFAHAFAAKREGDYTAVACKRYTLAPLAHFNLWGFLFLLVFGFGWANPVPVDTRNFKRGKKSEFMVAIAGIVMNLLLGTVFLFIFMCLLKFAPEFLMGNSLYANLLSEFLVTSVSFNFMLAFFNLLPIYPLDGYRIVDSCCKQDNAFLSFMRNNSLIVYLIFAISGLYTLYYNVTAGLLLDGLQYLFKLILRLWEWKKF